MRNWRENHVGIQLQVSNDKKFKSDIHVIARRLRDKKARGEPITIENFVIDMIIIIIINYYYYKYD